MKLTEIIDKETALDGKVFEAELSDGMFFSIRYVSQINLQALIEGSKVNKFNPDTRQRETVVDTKKFTDRFTRAFLHGWRGVTARKLVTKMPLKVGALTDAQWDEEIEFSIDDGIALVRGLPGLDMLLQTIGTNVSHYQTIPEGTGPNSSPSPSGT